MPADSVSGPRKGTRSKWPSQSQPLCSSLPSCHGWEWRLSFPCSGQRRGRAGSHQGVVFASGALEVETGEKQTNSCHLPRVLEEVPFTARNVTGSEVSQEAACGGRDAGSWAEDQRRRAGDGARAGRSAATISPGRGKEPRGRDVPEGWEGPTAQQDLHLSWAT